MFLGSDFVYVLVFVILKAFTFIMHIKVQKSYKTNNISFFKKGSSVM